MLQRIYSWSGSGWGSRASFVRNSKATATWGWQPWEGLCSEVAAEGVKDSQCPRSASGNSHTRPPKLEHFLIYTFLPTPVLAAVPALLFTWGKWEFTITKSPCSAATVADAAEQTSPCLWKEWQIPGVTQLQDQPWDGSTLGDFTAVPWQPGDGRCYVRFWPQSWGLHNCKIQKKWYIKQII